MNTHAKLAVGIFSAGTFTLAWVSSFNASLVSSPVQIGQVTTANPALRKFGTWAAKAVGGGALTGLGGWIFNQAVAKASTPTSMIPTDSNYVGSTFVSEQNDVYLWARVGGKWHVFNSEYRTFVPSMTPQSTVYRTADWYSRNGQYVSQKPSGNFAYNPRIGWVRLQN